VDHLKILAVKFIVIALAVLVVFMLFGQASVSALLGVSLLTAVASYLIGDLLVLKAFGNVVATVADFVLIFVLIWMLSAVFIGTGGYPVEPLAMMSAVLITCAEPFIHRYIRRGDNPTPL
jgi:hypothetical protein